MLTQKIKRNIHHLLCSFFVKKSSKDMVGDANLIRNAHPELLNHLEGEDIWLEKWRNLYPNVSPSFYRIYGRCIKNNQDMMDIVPDDAARSFIEPALNPVSMTAFYNDKNSFGLFIDKKDMPEVFFRSMAGKTYNGEYQNIKLDDFMRCLDGHDKVVVKPACGMGGAGVRVFTNVNGGGYYDKLGVKLDTNYLDNNYKTNYLIQEFFIQSSFSKQFNPSSVNTIRMATYRDINNGEIHILGAVIRIGNEGSEVDNATEGGVFVGIADNGKLMDVAWDHNCNKYASHNGIDFSKQSFVVPNYERVKQFAKHITERLPHMSLLALDIVLDENDNPKLIELNSQSFTWYFYQFPTGPAFGKHTKDVLDFCIYHKDEYKVSAFRYLAHQ